jgi:uncharacterized protein YjbI with pentapeptide repeats
MTKFGHIGRVTTLLLPLLILGAAPVQAKCSDSPRPKVDWTKCDKEKKILRGQDMSGGIFERTDLSLSNLSGSTLTGARMGRATLNGTRFQGADLTGADLSKALGSRADFEGAKLARATLSKGEFPRAIFAGADLTGADLSKAEFGRAALRDAILEGADLSYANLARADLGAARLAGADLTGIYTLLTRVEGTDLSGATGLSQQQLDIACGDAETKLPEGLARPADWPCPPVEEE